MAARIRPLQRRRSPQPFPPSRDTRGACGGRGKARGEGRIGSARARLVLVQREPSDGSRAPPRPRVSDAHRDSLPSHNLKLFKNPGLTHSPTPSHRPPVLGDAGPCSPRQFRCPALQSRDAPGKLPIPKENARPLCACANPEWAEPEGFLEGFKARGFQS